MKKLNIGFYKPYKKLYFKDGEHDTNSWSRENVNLMKIFASHGHQFFILSDTDYDGSIDNIANSSFGEVENLDFLFVSNGIFDKDQLDEADIFKFAKDLGAKTVLLETDLGLTLKYHNRDVYDLVLSQAKTKNENCWYGYLEKLILYHHPISTRGYNHRLKKGVFIGFERDRTEQIAEYVIRPNIVWKGKGSVFKHNDKVGKAELNRLLQTHLFSIVMSGTTQNKFGFVSQRYYENALNGIINFVDNEFDRYGLIIAQDDWRRVKNYTDLYIKVSQLNKEKFDELQTQQFEEIVSWIDGEKIYKTISRILEKYSK